MMLRNWCFAIEYQFWFSNFEMLAHPAIFIIITCIKCWILFIVEEIYLSVLLIFMSTSIVIIIELFFFKTDMKITILFLKLMHNHRLDYKRKSENVVKVHFSSTSMRSTTFFFIKFPCLQNDSVSNHVEELIAN